MDYGVASATGWTRRLHGCGRPSSLITRYRKFEVARWRFAKRPANRAPLYHRTCADSWRFDDARAVARSLLLRILCLNSKEIAEIMLHGRPAPASLLYRRQAAVFHQGGRDAVHDAAGGDFSGEAARRAIQH